MCPTVIAPRLLNTELSIRRDTRCVKRWWFEPLYRTRADSLEDARSTDRCKVRAERAPDTGNEHLRAPHVSHHAVMKKRNYAHQEHREKVYNAVSVLDRKGVLKKPVAKGLSYSQRVGRGRRTGLFRFQGWLR